MTEEEAEKLLISRRKQQKNSDRSHQSFNLFVRNQSKINCQLNDEINRKEKLIEDW